MARALISYDEYSAEPGSSSWLDVYRLPEWCLQAHLRMDCHARFNISPQWSTFIPSPDGRLIYVYKTRTLGHHLAEDFICALDLREMNFVPWTFRIPKCVAAWSASGGRAHAQMLLVADGIEQGRLPVDDLEQRVAFWLGPEEGMGPAVSIGARPRVHGDLGHARAIVFAPQRPISAVVCTDGRIHVIDPVGFRYLDRQRTDFAGGHAMRNFAAHIEPRGRFLYVGTAEAEARCQGLIERVVVHDLDRRRQHDEWILREPFTHMGLTPDGKYMYGAVTGRNGVRLLEAESGRVVAGMELDGFPQYVIAS